MLTHSAGVPFASGPRPSLRRMNDSEYTRRKLAELKPIHRPGRMHIYHGLTWGPLVREIVSAATGQNIRDILAAEVLDPLGFRWTNYGVAESDVRWWRPVTVPAVAPADRRGVPHSGWGTMQQIIPFSNTPLFLTGVIPSSSTVSTADELSRFAEIPRRGASSTVCGSCARKPCAPRWHPAADCARTWRRGWPRCGGAPVTCSAPPASGRSVATPPQHSATPA
jgi:CubicO group peptidase (beta-lactamase class C family)